MATRAEVTEIYERERTHIIAHLNSQHGIAFEDAEDALQDVMCRLLEHWRDSRATLQHWKQEDLIAFFIVAVKNQCIDVYRKYQRNL